MKNTKEYKATQKFLLISPRKVRPVADMIRKMKPVDAIAKLPFVQKRGARELLKVVKAALASAKAQGVSETDLQFSEVRVNEGPRLKRGIAVSRGQWHPIKKRMSHIRVILVAQNKPITQSANKPMNEKMENNKKVTVAKKGTKKDVA